MYVTKNAISFFFLLLGFAACVSTQPTPSYGPIGGMPSEPGKCYAKSIYPQPVQGAEYKEGKGYLAWAEVVCAKDINGKLVRRVRQALYQSGDLSDDQRSVGEIDEAFNTALKAFQTREGLPIGGLNKQTLALMGYSSPPN